MTIVMIYLLQTVEICPTCVTKPVVYRLRNIDDLKKY